MTRIYVGSAALTSLGTVGELDLLTAFDGRIYLPDTVRAEVTTEPARTNVERFVADNPVVAQSVDTGWTAQALRVLDAAEPTSDVRVVEGILQATADEPPDAETGGESTPAVGLVSDDRRLRTVAAGFGATVTGTFGVVVRGASADKYISTAQAKRIVRRIDSHGLHLTGELREQAIGSTE